MDFICSIDIASQINIAQKTGCGMYEENDVSIQESDFFGGYKSSKLMLFYFNIVLMIQYLQRIIFGMKNSGLKD